jgi:4-hydroxy-tetrahydrodipicolinate reductase
MLNIILCGAGGRMGQAVIEAVRENPEYKIAAVVEHSGHPSIGKPFAEGLPSVLNDMVLAMNAGDVCVEFTTPEATLANAKKAAIIKKPMVIGTTGLVAGYREIFQELAREIPMVVSSNMSIGVNLLYALVRGAAKKLPKSFQAEVFEAHHQWKKDAPSGTAARLAEEIIKVRGGAPVYERQSRGQARQPGEVGVYSMRAGDIIGEHTVYFAGPGERIELTHRAHNRRVFAEGALLAASFVATAKPGLYDMQDVLGLR